jgi:hypothetical protein
MLVITIGATLGGLAKMSAVRPSISNELTPFKIVQWRHGIIHDELR